MSHSVSKALRCFFQSIHIMFFFERSLGKLVMNSFCFRDDIRASVKTVYICPNVSFGKCLNAKIRPKLKVSAWDGSSNKALVTFRIAWAANCIHPQCNLMSSVLWLVQLFLLCRIFDAHYAGAKRIYHATL